MVKIIPDPIELRNSKIESLMDNFVDEYTCMQCGKKVDYELLCMSPMGDGPCVCVDCSGLTAEQLKQIGY